MSGEFTGSKNCAKLFGHDNTVTYRTVKLGSVIDGKRVVREGLQPGETIIVNGLQRVRPGMTVAPELQAVATTPAAAPAVDKIAALR